MTGDPLPGTTGHVGDPQPMGQLSRSSHRSRQAGNQGRNTPRSAAIEELVEALRETAAPSSSHISLADLARIIPNPYRPYPRWTKAIKQVLEIRKVDLTKPQVSADVAVLMWNKLPEHVRALAPQHSFQELTSHLDAYDRGTDQLTELFSTHWQERLTLLYAEKKQIAREACPNAEEKQVETLAWKACINQLNVRQRQFVSIIGVGRSPTANQLERLDETFGVNFLGPKPATKGSNNQDQHKGDKAQQSNAKPKKEFQSEERQLPPAPIVQRVQQPALSQPNDPPYPPNRPQLFRSGQTAGYQQGQYNRPSGPRPFQPSWQNRQPQGGNPHAQYQPRQNQQTAPPQQTAQVQACAVQEETQAPLPADPCAEQLQEDLQLYQDLLVPEPEQIPESGND